MSIVNAFASPLGVETSKVSQIVSGKYFERTRHRLLESLRKAGHRSLTIQAENLSAPRGSSWRPEVGLASTACATGQMELAALQLAVLSADADISVRARVEAPSPLLADGWVVSVQGDVAVQTGGGELSIQSDLGFVNFRTEGARLVDAAPDSNQFWRVSAIECRQPRYAIESNLGFSAGNFPWPAKFGDAGPSKLAQDSASTAHSTAALSRAMALVGETSPHYMEWISSVVDGFLLAAGPATYGISSPDFPGLVALSSLGNELDYAEAVVAEACHQYLFQLLLVSPLTAAGAEEIHYIPARRFYLTTRRALVAAHVHANVILMLRQLETRSEHAASAKLRITRRLLMLDTDCMPALQVSTQLTETGRELYLRVQDLVAP